MTRVVRVAALRIAEVCALFACAVLSAHGATPLTGATALAVGPNHACVAMQGGGAQCWGFALTFLTLGRPTPGFAAGPVQSLPESLSHVAVGEMHSCAATTGGGVKCWGTGYYGALGTGGPQDSPVPVDVVSLPVGIAALTAGARHTCSVNLTGAARCWGDNQLGQLGIGASGNIVYAPASVSGLGSAVSAIDAGSYYTCAIAGGAAKCFGGNFFGQLGDGTNQDRTAPVQVAGLTAGVTRISAGGGHACAIVAGAVKCWGYNGDGQLGDGTFADRNAPVDVVTLGSGIVAVSAGFTHTCALRQDGVVLCWGSNQFGQLGDGTLNNRVVPAPVIALGGPAVAVAAGQGMTCALRADGAVRCFGSNDNNRLGIASQPIRATPRAVAAPDWAQLDAGAAHTCGVSGTGAALCFGDNMSSQLGTGTPISRALPAPVAILDSGVLEVVAGNLHSCARTAGGAAWCWGQNFSGQLGDDLGARQIPGPVPGLASGVADIDVGYHHSCAVTDAGGALCWGSNSYGQLGDGTFVQRSNPAPVSGLPATVAAIATGENHSCALRTTGGVKCWGFNSDGQLGDGSSANRNLPVDVVGLTAGATSVAAGARHSCAVTAIAGVRCWGSNGSGQLGDGSTVTKVVPVAVPGLPAAAIAVAAGESHSCALLADGSVHCWGNNGSGQIGPNAAQSSQTAVPVPIGAPAVSITAGYAHSCARLADGGAVCWGSSFSGQLGNGDAQLSALPRDVLVGDFTTATALATTPSPSDADDLVTLSVVVSNADVAPEGFVEFFDGGAPICGGVQLTFGRGTCVANLTPGTHTLTARYIATFGLLPSQASIQHVVNPIAGQTCAGFDDLDAVHPLCPSVDWVRNRNVTLGCTGFQYCGADLVNRLSMAAFMNRVGRALSPGVEAASAVSVLVASGFHQCLTALPDADHPRRVLVDVMVTGTPSGGAGDVELRAIASRQFQFLALGAAAVGTAVAGRSMALTATATFDVPAGANDLQFGLHLAPKVGLSSYSLDGGCATRAIILNRNATHGPYDPQP